MPSVFDGYPYSNTHQLNLDWIIAQIKQVSPLLEELKKTLEAVGNFDEVLNDTKDATNKANAAAERAYAAGEGAENAVDQLHAATVNGTPILENPVLTAESVGAAPDTVTINSIPILDNPVLTAASVGAAPDTATINGIPILDNPVLTAASVGAAPYATVSVQAGAPVKIATSGNFFVIARLTAAQGTTGVYAVTAYSEYRAPHVVSLADGAYITVSTGGSDDTGWYVEFTNTRGAGTVLLAIYGGFRIV